MQCVSPFFCTFAPVKRRVRVQAAPQQRVNSLHSVCTGLAAKTKIKIKNGTSIQLHYQPGCISHDANPLYHYRSVYRHEVRKVIEIGTLRGCRFRGIGYCDSPADQQLR